MHRWAIAVCVLICLTAIFVLYFASIGKPPLMDPDEPVYGQVAKEMADGGGWLTPHLDGIPWFDKPPLFYWLTGISAKLLGLSEFSVRLPSAIMAVILLCLVYALAIRDFSRRTAIFASIIMATCLQQIVLARACVTDMTFAVCLTAALYAYRRWLDGRIGWAILCGAMTGLAMLAKGPVAPVLLGATIIIHLLWTRRLLRLRSIDALIALVAFAIVGLPWYTAMYLNHRHAFVEGFLVANNLTRFLSAEHPGTTGHWYFFLLNIPTLVIFFFPWSFALPQAVLRGRRTNEGARLAFVWIAVVFVFFSISKTQLVTYIFPLYPAAALFVAFFWNEAADGDAKARRGITIATIIAWVLSILIALALCKMAAKEFPDAHSAIAKLGVALVVGLTLPLIGMMAIRPKHVPSPAHAVAPALVLLGIGMCLFAGTIAVEVMPIVALHISTREVVQYIPQDTGITVAELNLVRERHSILYYYGRYPIHAGSFEDAERLLAGPKPVYLIRKKSEIAKVMANNRSGTMKCRAGGSLAVVANQPGEAWRGSGSR